MAKPWGDSSRYDVVVETGGHFARVQVKSTANRQSNGGYVCGVHPSPNGELYSRGDFDFRRLISSPTTSGTSFRCDPSLAPKGTRSRCSPTARAMDGRAIKRLGIYSATIAAERPHRKRTNHWNLFPHSRSTLVTRRRYRCIFGVDECLCAFDGPTEPTTKGARAHIERNDTSQDSRIFHSDCRHGFGLARPDTTGGTDCSN